MIEAGWEAAPALAQRTMPAARHCGKREPQRPPPPVARAGARIEWAPCPRRRSTRRCSPQPPLPQFDVQLAPPDLSAWREGNCGVPGFTTRAGPRRRGRMWRWSRWLHGNEIAGAIVLDRLLRAGLRPQRGRLTFGFANLAAFDRFDAAQPTASRFLDEDMNRLWDPAVLDGAAPLDRTRPGAADASADRDAWTCCSTCIRCCGRPSRCCCAAAPPKGRALARGDRPAGAGGGGYRPCQRPAADRLRPFRRSAAAPQAAVLVEAGQHWETGDGGDDAGERRRAAAASRHGADSTRRCPRRPPHGRPRFAEVTQVVTAATASFSFVRPFRGGDVVRARDTLIAIDGETEIRTPHDDCLLVMPSLRPSRGHTAVRLARIRAAGGGYSSAT